MQRCMEPLLDTHKYDGVSGSNPLLPLTDISFLFDFVDDMY